MTERSFAGREIIEHLKWRYAAKRFDPEGRVSDEDWAVLEKALLLAPSSYGLQPYRFTVVTDPALKAKLSPACYGQPQITECSHLVVFTARKDLLSEHVEEYASLIVETRGAPRETLDGFVAMIEGMRGQLESSGASTSWSQRQAYIALGFLLETAALMRIDACPMEGFQPEKVDKILGLTDYTSTVLCALGYRSEEDRLAAAKKVRFSAAELIDMR